MSSAFFDGIACWFPDTDDNGESVVVRHAHVPGQNGSPTALSTTFTAEIDTGLWATLNSGSSQTLPAPDLLPHPRRRPESLHPTQHDLRVPITC